MKDKFLRGEQKTEKKTKSEAGEKKFKAVRLILWVFVILIQLMVVAGIEIRAEIDEEERLTIRSQVYPAQGKCPKPQEVYQTDEGKKYSLLSWKKESIWIPSYERRVEKEFFCDGVEGAAEIPKKLVINVRDGGRETEAFCYLQEKEIISERWKDGFDFIVTFHDYGAGEYVIGDRIVEKEEEKPQFEGCEKLLLEEIGVKPQEYRIEGVRWDGAAYEDLEGFQCRDAVAYGQKLMRDYRLRYEGIAVFPSYEGWRTIAVYGDGNESGQGEQRSEGASKDPLLSEDAGKKDRRGTELPFAVLWKKVIRILLVTIAVGALLFFGGLLILAMRKVKKAVKQKWKIYQADHQRRE